ncbi:AMP-binding protein [Halopseudomonas pachastrellae]|nr:AMP-binding protein [Halopseudomonas pachastrellae]
MTADGFLRTGDVGYMDEDGYVYIVDRTKDMILCSGLQRLSARHRGSHYEYPGVEEVSVIRHPGCLSRAGAQGLY